MEKDSLINKNGFTLIELLIVIVMIGSLAAVSISLLAPKSTVGRARDGVRLSSVKAIAESAESYKQLERVYPTFAQTQDSTSVYRTIYIKKWPDPISDSGAIDAVNWSYRYAIVGTDFVTFSPNSAGGCFKYQSNWGKVRTCPLSECNTNLTAIGNCN